MHDKLTRKWGKIMSVGVILMSRAPIPGKTKTRLQSHLTGKQCAKLHKAFLKDISNMLVEVSKQRENVNLYLTYTPPGTEEMFNDLIPDEFDFFAQQGEDLGQKMYYALEHVAQEDERQIILGSDLPTLQLSVILDAIDQLQDKDVVVGPSQDGGYYLLGTKEPVSCLFDDIIFGKNDVLKATIKAIRSQQLSYNLVETWSDIDLYPELVELHKELQHRKQWEIYPEATAKLAASFLQKIEDEGGDIYGKQAK